MLNAIIAPVIVFAIIVIVHEGGHFFMAKLTGMKVDEFAVGFGPKIVSFRKGETLYSLRAIPLGGYNKIAGMNRDDLDDPRAFRQRPTWAKLLVIAGGALFNILLAFFIFTAIFFINGIHTFKDIPVAGSVLEESSAARAGIKAGDKIISINGEKVERWEDIGRIVSDKAGRVLSVVIDSEGVKKRSLLFQRTMERGAQLWESLLLWKRRCFFISCSFSWGRKVCLYIKDNGCRAGGYTCRSRSRCGRAHRCGPHGRNRGGFRNDGALCIYRASEFESGLFEFAADSAS